MNRTIAAHRRSRTSRRSNPCRPIIEWLEQRTLLSEAVFSFDHYVGTAHTATGGSEQTNTVDRTQAQLVQPQPGGSGLPEVLQSQTDESYDALLHVCSVASALARRDNVAFSESPRTWGVNTQFSVHAQSNAPIFTEPPICPASPPATAQLDATFTSTLQIPASTPSITVQYGLAQSALGLGASVSATVHLRITDSAGNAVLDQSGPTAGGTAKLQCATFVSPPGGETYTIAITSSMSAAASAGGTGATVSASANLRLSENLMDFGDAPDSYKTASCDDGPRHIVTPGLFLGSGVDLDADGQPTVAALGDDQDSDGDDEDGVHFTTTLVPGQNATVAVMASAAGELSFWIDSDRSGTFDFNELVTQTFSGAETRDISFLVPGDATLGPSYARFRFSTQPLSTPYGTAPDGEVEDYAVEISPTLQTIFVVTNRNDSGTGSLRQAITDANATANLGAPDVIRFDGSTCGIQTIQPLSALPTITQPVTIDATKPGCTGPLVELDGSAAGASSNGLFITAGNSTVRGLVINRFGAAGIWIQTSGGNQIEGNYIGVDKTGVVALGNGTEGLVIFSSSNRVGTNGDGTADANERNVISGNKGAGVAISGANQNVVAGNYIGVDTTGIAMLGNGSRGVIISGGAQSNRVGTDGNGVADLAERNIISGNGVVVPVNGHGVQVTGAGTSNNIVAGNFIGTDVTGTIALGNRSNGIAFSVSAGANRVGTNADGVADDAERNVISGNLANGVLIRTSNSNVVAGNYIGVSVSGSSPLGNGLNGVHVDVGAAGNRIGGSAAEGNIIAFSGGRGVILLDTSNANTIRANRIYSNGSLGIDLAGNGVTPNDSGDADTGTNGLQNFPVVSSAVTGATTRVLGSLNSTANTTFTIDFYASSAPDPSGFGEGERYLGSKTIATDGAGNASYDVTLPAATTAGEVITATATNPAGSTSEFSQVPDDDVDGVSTQVEDRAPNGGDGNSDGVPDSQQANVTSLPNSADSSFVTLASPTGTGLQQVGATANPSPADAPPGAEFPIGFLDFAVGAVPPGGSATVQIIVQSSATLNTYFKFGRTSDNTTPHWYQFLFDGTTGTEINGNVITLHFVDGQRGDDDLAANGRIVDPGAPVADTESPDTSITAGPPSLSFSPNASFSFTGSDNISAAASLAFECRLDAGAFAACVSPRTYTGLADGSHTFEVKASDVAGNTDLTPDRFMWTVVTTVSQASVLVLNPTACGALTISGNASIEKQGRIEVASRCSSALVASGNARLTASQILVAGGVQVSGNATFSPAPVTGATVSGDPLAALSDLDVTALPSQRAVNCSGNSQRLLQPGRYSQIKASGNCVLTMSSGIYAVEAGGFQASGNASVSGQGVVIYNVNGSVNLSGNGSFSLTPPAAGAPYAGVLIFQARNNTRPISVSGNASGMDGTIYAPKAQVTLSGSGLLKATLISDTLRLSGNALSRLMTLGSSSTSADTQVAILTEGQLVTGVLWVSARTDSGSLSSDQLARLHDATASLNDTLVPFGVALIVVDADSADYSDVRIEIASNSACGGFADGVLGCADASRTITIVDGWNWYTGADAGSVGANQYDFQTIVTHELGHAVGLEHSSDGDSVMYAMLSTGVARRNLSTNDLAAINRHDHADGSPDALVASGLPVTTGHICSPASDHAGSDRIVEQAAYILDRVTLIDGRYDRSPRQEFAAGRAADILVGGDGNDLAVGGNGRDILIGGYGADRLTGSGAADLWIGSSTLAKDYAALDSDLSAADYNGVEATTLIDILLEFGTIRA